MYCKYPDLSRKDPLTFTACDLMAEVLELPCYITERSSNFYSLQQDGRGIGITLIYHRKIR